MGRELFAAGKDGTRIYVRYREGPGGIGSLASGVGAGSERLTAVLCDGIACDGFIWKYLWDDLARTVNVAHWNYRGHGRSSLPVDPKAVELRDHASDLVAVRAAIGDGPVVLFGHSMGCQVILEHLRTHREGVRGLVLICGSSGRITHHFKGTDVLAQLLPRLIEQVDAYPHIARAIWSRVPAPMALRIALLAREVDASAVTPADLLPYMRHMVDIDFSMFLHMLRSAGEHSTLDLLPQIDLPALVIAGDRDTFTPPRLAEEMAAALPRGELMMVSGGTHVVPLERKKMVIERVEQFLLERVLGGAPVGRGASVGPSQASASGEVSRLPAEDGSAQPSASDEPAQPSAEGGPSPGDPRGLSNDR
ncbi:alpha/beta fold hydrolase [Sorangium sp. So ce341]|uniref:alpha/beta fold hydrolase n=1 Tax=Sorangium sp. So ce341 TaxID=3133302 RepID=UPI003F629E09